MISHKILPGRRNRRCQFLITYQPMRTKPFVSELSINGTLYSGRIFRFTSVQAQENTVFCIVMFPAKRVSPVWLFRYGCLIAPYEDDATDGTVRQCGGLSRMGEFPGENQKQNGSIVSAATARNVSVKPAKIKTERMKPMNEKNT
jgi:hypothetical protein